MTMRRALLGIALALAVAPAVAQIPGAADVTRVKAGTYKMDPNHSQIAWTINHFGFSLYHGLFGEPTGTLTLDPANPGGASVNVTIPIDKVVTTSSQLNDHLRTADFFDAKKFPTATFVSSRVVPQGQRARIEGNLTIRGVTKPVVLDAQFTGAGDNPMSKAATIGFQATTSIKRSDFGIVQYVPALGDQVDLVITAAFERQS
jgi:polyisoprenoid-binding protein YceI